MTHYVIIISENFLTPNGSAAEHRMIHGFCAVLLPFSLHLGLPSNAILTGCSACEESDDDFMVYQSIKSTQTDIRVFAGTTTFGAGAQSGAEAGPEAAPNRPRMEIMLQAQSRRPGWPKPSGNPFLLLQLPVS